MKDFKRYDLRQLTEAIFYIREYLLKFLDPSSKEYIDVTKQYEKLWTERDALENEVFKSKEQQLSTIKRTIYGLSSFLFFIKIYVIIFI